MSYEIPETPFPENIGACFTQRLGGFSDKPYEDFNLGLHVGDNPKHVFQNREKILLDQGINRIFWLNQVHGTHVVLADAYHGEKKRLTEKVDADASYSTQPGLACAIMVADCLPILVSDTDGSIVGAAHAGWRGLCNGVLTNLLADMAIPPEKTLVWLGPCISRAYFEVGEEVLRAFQSSRFFRELKVIDAFQPKESNSKKYLADLQQLAQMQLDAYRVKSVYCSNSCVYRDSRRYFSYRRDKDTGRMAALIWLKN